MNHLISLFCFCVQSKFSFLFWCLAGNYFAEPEGDKKKLVTGLQKLFFVR